MKAQINQHHSQLGIIAILVGFSILLLAFGIYKTIAFQNNHLLSTYHPTSTSGLSASALPAEYGDFLYSHVFTDEAVEAPLHIEEWMTNYSSWLTHKEAEVNYKPEEYDNESPLELEEWMTDLSEWEIAPAESWNNEMDDFEPELELALWMMNDSAWYNMNSIAETTEHTESEASLPLENWMMNLEKWDVPVLTEAQFAELDHEKKEDELAIEHWMLSCCTWLSDQKNFIDVNDFIQTQQKEALKFEA